MSTILDPAAGRAVLQQNRAGRGERFLRGLRTPGGGVFVLLLVLLVAIIIQNPSFGEPESLIRFIRPHRPDCDCGDRAVLRDRLR